MQVPAVAGTAWEEVFCAQDHSCNIIGTFGKRSLREGQT